MTKLILCIILALAASSLGQQPSSPAADQEATTAISHLREGIIDAFRKGDVENLLSFLDPEVVVTWQNGEVCHGRDAVRSFYARMMAGPKPIVREIKSDPVVAGRHVYGEWAVSWGNLGDHFVLNDGSDLPFNSVFTATIAKRGDRWLVVAFHTSVNAFENPVLKLTARRTALWVGVGGGMLGLLLGFSLAYLLRRKQPVR